MSNISAGVIIWTIIFGIVSIGLLTLFVVGGYKSMSDEKKQTKSARRLQFFCGLFYVLSSFLVFSDLLTVIIDGWSDDGISAYVYYVFALFYTISLFLMIYVWIMRLETTFTNSMYEYSSKFMKFLKWLYWSIIIFGFLTLILFYIEGGGSSNQGILWYIIIIFAALWTILFIGELIILLIAFISKLVNLRKTAENRLNKANERGDYDIQSLLVIQKLIKLQLKLTICAVISIISTFFSIPLTLIFEQHTDVIIYGIDVFIGFICIHCTIKTNQIFYQYFCILCIKICKNCCMKEDILDEQINHHIQIYSKSVGSGSSGSPAKPSTTTQITYIPSNNNSSNDITENDNNNDNKRIEQTQTANSNSSNKSIT